VTSERLVTVAELAAKLAVSQREVYRLALTGRVPGFRVGRGWRFDVTEVLPALREEARP